MTKDMFLRLHQVKLNKNHLNASVLLMGALNLVDESIS